MLNQDKLKHINHNKNIWNSISEIQNICGLIDYDIAEILNVPTLEFKSKKSALSDLTSFEVLKIAEAFELDIWHLINNDFDHQIVKDRFDGKRNTLSSRYTENPFSKKRTQVNILNYLEENYFSLADSCYKRFQLNEECFENQDDVISIKFLEDLCDYLQSKKFSYEEFYKMGTNSYEVNKNSPMADVLKKCRSIPELYQFIAEGMSESYDLNFKYQIDSISSGVVKVTEIPSEKSLEANKGKVGNYTSTVIKSGVIASLPKFINKEEADISITKSAYHDSKYTQFTIEY